MEAKIGTFEKLGHGPLAPDFADVAYSLHDSFLSVVVYALCSYVRPACLLLPVLFSK